MPYLKAPDAISGQEGMAYLTRNGQNQTMFYAKTIEANLEKEKSDFKSLGKRITQHKTTGANGTGSMTIYLVTSIFAEMAENYAKNGIDEYFTMRLVNHDPTSSIGRQSLLLHNVNIDSFPLTKLDVDSEYLEVDVDFTFDGVTVLESFVEPTLAD